MELGETDRERVESIQPLGRIGSPEDVADVVAFLVSRDGAFVSGSNQLVDGGRTPVVADEPFLDYTSRFEH